MVGVSWIGNDFQSQEMVDKVMGRGIYGRDQIFPHLLVGKILRSPYPHALIKGIDTRAAYKVKGVRAILTGRDLPYPPFGQAIEDEPILAKERVRYIGEEVAVVAAESDSAARKALSLIQVEYEPLEAVFEVEEALKRGSPLLHKENLALERIIERGDAREAFSISPIIVEHTFRISPVHQGYMEPITAIACRGEGDRVCLHTALQSPHITRDLLAKALSWDPGRIRIMAPLMGGGFGGKVYGSPRTYLLAILLALETGSPAQISLSREEDLSCGRPQGGAFYKMRLGLLEDGTFLAKEMDVLVDNGAYSAQMPWVMKTLLERNDSLYHIPHLYTRGRLVYTNKVPTGQYRGYGNQMSNTALETLVDKAAKVLKMSPLAIRLKNCAQEGDVTVHGLKFKSCALNQCLERAAAEIGLHQEERGVGVGISCALHLNGNRSGYPAFDGSSAMIAMNREGMVSLSLGEQDYGQGLREAISLMVAQVLAISPQEISLLMKDTDKTPFSIGTLASRETTIGGHAAIVAAEKLKERLLEGALHLLGAKREEIVFEEGSFHSPIGSISIKEVARRLTEEQNGLPLIEKGVFHPPDTELPDETGYGNISPAYSFAAHGARVRAREETGEIIVEELVAVHDSGRILSHIRGEGQVEGGVAQGIGFALWEGYLFSEGRVLTSNFSTYLLPTIMDAPLIRPIFIEKEDPTGPFGAKALGEIAHVPTAAAVVNAISQLVGEDFHELPVNPELVYGALKRNREKKKEGSCV